MARSIDEFSERDIRRIESKFSCFICLETEGMCCTWQTDYYYTRFADGRYGFALIDPTDEELCDYEEYKSAKEFARCFTRDTQAQGFGPYADDKILSLFPKDLRKYKKEIAQHFTMLTGALISKARRKRDTELVNAFLPDFEEFRKTLNIM